MTPSSSSRKQRADIEWGYPPKKADHDDDSSREEEEGSKRVGVDESSQKDNHESEKLSKEEHANTANPSPPPPAPAPAAAVEEEEEGRFIEFWRWGVMICHLALFIAAACLWCSNLNGKWSAVPRRWSVSNLQFVYVRNNHRQRNYGEEDDDDDAVYPVMVVLGGGEEHYVEINDGDSGISWPRLHRRRSSIANDSFSIRRTVHDYSTWGVRPRSSQQQQQRQQGHGDLIFSEEKHKQGVFLGEVDVPIINLLVLWASVSYSIFALPRSKNFETVGRRLGSSSSIFAPLMYMWDSDWVLSVLLLWNGGGLVAFYILRAFVRDITPGNIFRTSRRFCWS